MNPDQDRKWKVKYSNLGPIRYDQRQDTKKRSASSSSITNPLFQNKKLSLQSPALIKKKWQSKDLLLSNLPVDLILRIFGYLEHADLCSLAQTCKEWKLIVDDGALWRAICFKKFPQSISKSITRSWKDLYVQYGTSDFEEMCI